MQISMRPPTKRMIEKLKECHEKKLKGDPQAPCFPEEMKSSMAGLYKRGFINTRMEIINNKEQLCIYVTESGKKLIRELADAPNKSN